MQKISSLLAAFVVFILATTTVRSQTTTVFSDNFDRSSFTDASTGGTPATTYSFTNALGAIGTSLVSGSNYQAVFTSATGGSAGNRKSYFTAPLNVYSSPFNPVLSANIGIVTWTFNMRISSAATGVPTQNTVGGGVDLCGNAATNIYNGSPNGYAVIFNSSSTGGVSLVKYSGGLNGATTLITQTTSVSKTHYYSVRVTYNPANNNWSLFVRDDGSSAFSDPSSGVTLQQGSTVTDGTYTNQTNTNYGALFTFTSTSGITMLLDNYTVGIAQCSGAPAPGNTVAAATTACIGFTDNLSLQNTTPGTGLSYVWESAPDVSGAPGTYTPTGATDGTYTATVSGATWYKCDVTCAYSSTTTSTAVQVGVSAAPDPITGSPIICNGSTSTLADDISGGTWASDNGSVATVSGGVVTAVSPGGANISYTLSSTGCSVIAPVLVLSSTPTITSSPSSSLLCSGGNTTLNASSTINLIPAESWESGVPSSPGTAVDGWNCIGGNSSYFSQQTGSGLSNPAISGAENGSSFLDFNSYSLSSGNAVLYSPSFNMTSVPNAQISLWVWRDYASPYTGGTYAAEGFKVALNTTNSTTGATLLGTIPRDAQTAITGASISGTSTTTTSGWYQYTFTMPGTFNGPVNYLLIVATSKDGNDCYLDNISITSTLNAVWSPTTNLYTDAGFTVPYTGTQASPVYFSSPSITSPTNTTYTASIACASSNILVSVNPIPSAITGSSSICTGNTTTYTNTSTGGLWSSSNTSVGTISSSAVLTSISSGTTNISYTFAGCGTASTTVTVNQTPDGSSFSTTAADECLGSNIPVTVSSFTLSGGNYTVNYTISGANTATGSATMTIGGGTGSFSLSGLSNSGSTTITINSVVNASGCSISPSGNVATFNVNPLPSSITGTPVACIGTTSTLIDGGSGSWSSGSTAIATVGFISGDITGIAAGTTTITYTLPTGCTTTTTVTINSTSPITGPSGTCLATSVTLSDAAAGTWISSDATIASVTSSTGVVSGVSLGTANITFTDGTNGCPVSVPFTVTPPPSVYIATGGGGYCSGGAGVHIGLSNSGIGYTYQLFSGVTPISGITPGTASPLDFGAITTGGTYTVIANPGTACATTMYGSATVTVNALPASYSVTGGGGYCATGLGVNVGLGASDLGVNYQLLRNGVNSGLPIPGTSTSIDFGLETGTGTYTVVATNSLTGCVNNMTGGTTVTVNPLPLAFSVTGGGGYCPGSAGTVVGLGNSTTGISYQLLVSGTATGLPITSSGSALNFGPQTTVGSYTISATDPATSCSNTMSGSATVSLNPLPTAYTVGGGGSYCTGTTGVHVSLNNSDIGITYQLYNGSTTVGVPVAGTNAPLDFGALTAIGTYTVSATSPATTCSNGMTGNAVIATIPLPNPYPVSGGGNYCVGGSGVDVSLTGSDTDPSISYQLYNGILPEGTPMSATGLSIDFGNQTDAGTYTVQATSATTGCVNTMPGTAVVIINTPPTAYPVTGGGNYCVGGTGVHIGMGSTTSGVSYQLFNGSSSVGSPVISGGGAIDFGAQTVAGGYTVVATSPFGCSSNMTGSAFVNINPLPVSYTVGGGGGYCAGSAGSHITLSGSDVGTNYQLYYGTSTSGSTVSGTGSILDFGPLTSIGTYTVSAVTPATSCASGMSGSAVVFTNARPIPYPVTVDNGGVYCAGSTGVQVGVATVTAGISYQLYKNGISIGAPVPSLGTAINFGYETLAGTYSVIATDPVTTCSGNMGNNVTVSIASLPALYTVSGGGSYCPGSTGVHVTLSGSGSGVNYQLYNSGSGAVSLIGSGSAIDFGIFTATGSYTVVAVDPVTSCSVNMLSSAIVSANVLPAAFTVTGGGSYCIGGTGVSVMLSNSNTAINYQLYNGTTAMGSPIPGTGGGLDFGLQTVTGPYSVIATDAATACTQAMTLTVNVNTVSAPTPYFMSGGGGYCDGGAGVPVGLTGSLGGLNYQLYIDGTATGTPLPGSGSALAFGTQTTAGTYTVIASDPSSTCSGAMRGTAIVSVNPSPIAYTVAGGGNYCAGGSGVHVGLSNSQSGVSYQLYSAGLTVGTAVTGTGGAIDLGAQTTAGNYSISAIDPSTSCTNTMNDSVAVGINPAPFAYTLTGGGGYCAGSTGATITLSGSAPGVVYQLYNGSAMVGTSVAGTSAPLSSGPYTATGVYSIIATDATTGCQNAMANNDTININPLPSAYAVTGGGNYCAGGAGMHIRLINSQSGVNYQLYNGTTPIGTATTGSGATLDLGAQTLAGVYTISATNAMTGCRNTMTGSASININPLPTTYPVTGGGNYCIGGVGLHIGLSGSQSGVNYQLYNGSGTVGSTISGGGSSIDFGLETTTGTYTVTATNVGTGCINNMTGNATIGTRTAPAVFAVTQSSPAYCAGGTGVIIYVGGSEPGVNYQLYRGTLAIGTAFPGSGGGLDLGPQTTTGTYTVVGVEAGGACSSTMAGIANVSVALPPNAYSVVGGGSYCSGGSGTHIGLSNSQTGIKYQVYYGGSPAGGITTGTGAAIDLGTQTTAGTYTVLATNSVTGCTNNMTGSASVVVNPLPTVYATTGGGNYCTGGTGVNIGLSSSVTGTSYQLYYSTTPIGGVIAGTGLPVSMGLQTIAGTYTIIALNGTTGCTNNMTGSATVGINPLPAPYAVTGGGNYCPGGTGVHVNLGSSAPGISYQLFNGTTAVGSPVTGTGSAIDFGTETTAGLYKVVATNPTTSCTANMTGTAVVGINTLPDVYTVTGGGNYCSGTGGVHIGLSNSGAGISYQLFNGTVSAGSPVIGSGSILDFGSITATGTYTVVATNGTTSCSSNMTGMATVNVTPSVTTAVSISTGSGDTACSGILTTFTAAPVNGGSTPAYQWSINSIPVSSTSSSYSYLPMNGDVVSVTLMSSAACATPATVANNITMTVLSQLMPLVAIAADPGNTVCNGTSVTFTATGTNGGSAPAYQWRKNGGLESTSSTYTYTPANGDVVYCQMSSNYQCRSANTVNSTHINMDVVTPATPTLVVTADPNTHIGTGEEATLTAIVTNGVAPVTYQWYVDGNMVAGATAPVYISTFANLDTVSCVVSTSGTCSGITGGAGVRMYVSNVGVKQVNAASGDVQLVPNPNKGIFTLKGTLGTTTQQEVSVEITNMLGQVIYNNKVAVQNGSINEKIQLNNVANGMYLLNLRTETGNQVFHLVIEQ